MVNVNANNVRRNTSKSAAAIAASFNTRVVTDGGVVEALPCLISQIQSLKSLGFFSKASFLLTPNGYKEDKLYTLLPSSGGDFTFTRATTAKRQGTSIIEDVPYNLLRITDDLSNVVWIKSNVTVLTNVATAPDGASLADKFHPTTTGTFRSIRQATQTVIGAGTYTQVVYAKADGMNWLVFADLGSTVIAYVDVSNGTTGFVNGSYTVNVTSAGNGWFKITVIGAGAANPSAYLQVSDGNLNTTATVNGTNGILIWKPQLFVGSVELNQFTVTDRLDVPRINYPVPTGCPSILLEPQRTNLFLRSEEFDNATIWTNSNTTEVANATTSPDGLNTADNLLETAVTSGHYIQQNVTKAASSIQYTLSCYVKPNGRDWCVLQGFSGANAIAVFFNVSTGAIGVTITGGAGFTLQNKTTELSANGFYKCILVFTTDATTTVSVAIGPASADNVYSYLGDITKGIYVWGAQLETGPYASSYIPTTSATVTRNADLINDLIAPSLIGQTEGTLYTEFTSFADSLDKIFLEINDGGTNNRILLRATTANQFVLTITTGGVTEVSIIAGTLLTTGTNFKIAAVYRTNYAALFINGVKINEDLLLNLPVGGYNRIAFKSSISSAPMAGYVKVAAISKMLITDAQAISLTTP